MPSKENTVEAGRREIPAYQRIIDFISGTISNEGLVPGSPLPSERQLSLDFGVARATVVRAMRELERSGLVERRRGQGTFVADVLEPARPSSTLACIVPNLHGAIVSGLIEGIEQAARQTGYSLVLSSSDANLEQEAELLENARRTANGALLWPLDSRANIELIDRVRRSGFPLVLVDRTLPGLAADSVVADNYSAGFLLTTVLLDLGHQRIAFVNGAESLVSSVTERLRGYRDALRARGVPFHSDWIVVAPYDSSVPVQRRHDYVARLLAHRPRTTAFIAVNAEILITLIHDLVHFGVRIPDDVALGTFDYVRGSILLGQATASVCFDNAAMGTQAVRLLLSRQRLGTALAERQIVIPVELRVPSPISVRIGPSTSHEHRNPDPESPTIAAGEDEISTEMKRATP